MKFASKLVCLICFIPIIAIASDTVDDLKQIMKKINEGRFDEALTLYSSNKPGFISEKVWFSYKDDFGDTKKIEGDKIRSFIVAARNFKAKCHSLLEDYKGLNDFHDKKNKLTMIEHECTGSGARGFRDWIDGYSVRFGVDLAGIYKGIDDQIKIQEDMIQQYKDREKRKAAQEAEAARKYEESPEKIAKDICQMNLQIKAIEEALREEQEVEKISGVADLARKREMGDAIHFSRKLEARLQKDYITKTGHKFNLRNGCK